MRKLVFFSLGIFLTASALAAPIKENIGLYGGQVSDIEAVDRSGSTELIIAVDSSQRGVFRWHDSAGRWGSVTNPVDTTITGHIPGSAALVEANPNSATDVYATLTWNSSGVFSRLYVSDNYGDLDPNVSWVESLDASGAVISNVTALVGHSSGMYAGTRDGVILLNVGAATDTFSAVFTHPSGDEIVAFAVASSSLGYVVSSSSSGALNLFSTDWAGTDTDLTGFLPAAAPVELHTGSCPITSCALEINLIGVDPITPGGGSIFIAGSSTNGQAFKSSDGGLTWNNGWDYQCSLASSGCAGFSFTDGYPQEIRFRGTATSGTESRNVFISRVVTDQDDTSPTWVSIPGLESTIKPSGPSGPTITMGTNANDGALAIDPIDSSILYIPTDLAIGEVVHTEGVGYASPSGFEKGNALGIDGLVINGLDYYENSPTDKELYVVAKSGIAFAKAYNPSDPTSVATRNGWVFPIYPLGDGAPPRAVKFDPSDKTLVLVGNGKVYRNPTADGAVSLTDVATNWTRVFDPNDSAFSGAGMPLESDRVERSYTTAIDWETAGGTCDRVYMTVANTDTGTEGGVFYSDDKGLTWNVDTLSGGLLKMPVNTISGVSESSLFPMIGVGDVDGRSSETGIYRRVSYCLSNDWSKPSHSSDLVFAEIQTKAIIAIDALSARPSSSTIDAIMFIAAQDAVYRGQLNSTSATTETGWNKWDFSDVTPSGATGFTDVAMEPDNTDHVWVAYDNCIQESTDGGLTWSTFSDSCQPNHEAVKILVYDELMAGSSGGAYAYTEISLSATTIEENSAGAIVGTLTPDSETYTYSLSGDDASSFEISNGHLKLLDSVSADYETQSSYSITVVATDSQNNTAEVDFSISVDRDTDGDGIGNNADTDDDNDGVIDTRDAFPLISVTGETDTDADGAPNNCDTECLAAGMTADTDDDGDSVLDTADAFPLISVAGETDTDADGAPNNCDTECLAAGMTADTDDDGDGVLDTADAFPLNATESVDTDGDGIGDNADPYPFGSDYETDEVDFYVTGQSINEALSSVNSIICYMKNMRPDALLNDGAYKAVIYKEDCEVGNADSTKESSAATATSAQSSSSASSSGSTTGAKSKTATIAVVDATKEGSNLPMTGKVWVNEIAQDEYSFDMKVYVYSEQTASVSADSPYGDFSMNWTMHADESKSMPWGNIVEGTQLSDGYLVASGNQVGFLEYGQFGEGNISATFASNGDTTGVYGEFIQNWINEYTSTDILAYYKFMKDDSEKVYCREFLSAVELDLNSPDADGAPSRIPYVPTGQEGITETEECFSTNRANAIRNVYRYGVYNQDESRVAADNPGFPIRAEVTGNDGATVNAYGYADYWGVWIDTAYRSLIDNNTVFTKETYGEQAGSTTYRVNPVTVRLQKRQKSYVSLNSLDGLSIGLWVGDDAWSEQYTTLGFADLSSYNEYKGSFDSATGTFTFDKGVSFAEGYSETTLGTAVSFTRADWVATMKRTYEEGTDWVFVDRRGLGAWSSDTNQWYDISHNSMENPDSALPANGVITQTESYVALDATEIATGLNCIAECPTTALMTTTFQAALAIVESQDYSNYVPSPYAAVGPYLKEDIGNYTAGTHWDGILAGDVVKYTFSGGRAYDPSDSELSLGVDLSAVPSPESALTGISFLMPQGWSQGVSWGVRSGLLVTDTDLEKLKCRTDNDGSYDDHPAYTGDDATALRYCEQKFWGVNELDTTYRLVFETRPQYKLTDQAGALISFSLPKTMYYDVPNDATVYGADAGKRISLKYEGFGELRGIPGYILNTLTGENLGEFLQGEWQQTYRYISRFTIPDGSTLIDALNSDITYKVKALNGEEWLGSASGSIGTMTYSGTTDDLLTSSVLQNRGPNGGDNYIGAEPTTLLNSGDPSVVHGEVVYDPTP